MSSPLHRLLYPRSIAVIGGTAASIVIEKTRELGFSGAIYAVNPSRDELAGVRCVNSIENLPEVPDACFVGVSADASIVVVEELANLGVGGVVCYASDFAESDELGKIRQQNLLAAAASGAEPIAVIGPNCHGVINGFTGSALWPDQHGIVRVDSGVAIVAQSGNVGINLTLQQRGLPLAHMITIGNGAQVGSAQVVDELLNDQNISAIGIHMEGIGCVEEWSRVAIRALRKKIPLVVLKTGVSDLGARLALSHSGSLNSSDGLADEFFRRFGIARCHTLGELLETLKFIHFGGVLGGPEISSMSCSGGEASHIADLLEAQNAGLSEDRRLKFSALDSTTSEALSEVLGPKVKLSNPLDYHTYIWGDLDRLTRCFTAMLQGQFDLTIVILDYPLVGSDRGWQTTEQALIAAIRMTGRRAVITASLPENMPLSARTRLQSAGIAPMQGLADTLAAAGHAYTIGQAHRSNLPRPVSLVLNSGRYTCGAENLADPPKTGNADRADAHDRGESLLASLGWGGNAPHILDKTRIKAPLQFSGGQALGEFDSKRLLQLAGLTVPSTRVCSVDKVVENAAQVGFPVVLKTASNAVIHKSELQAVHLNLFDDQEVMVAARALAKIDSQILVERMITGSVAELIVGVARDEVFGPTLLLGFGGVEVELHADTVQLLLPVEEADVRTALSRLRSFPLLCGFRGRPLADIDGVIDAVLIVARLIESTAGHIDELDINPLIVMPKGRGVVVADAWIRMSDSLTKKSP